MTPASRILATVVGGLSVVTLIRYTPDILRIIQATRILLAVDISSVIQPSRKKEGTA